MNKPLLAVLISASSTALASGPTASSGAGLTTGPSSSPYSFSAAKHNPAMNSFLLSDGESMRMGYFPSFGFAVEAGPVDNFADDLEELADIIDDPSSTDDDASVILDRFNDVLLRAGADGYVRFGGQAQLPLTPWFFYSETLKGTVGIDLSFATVGGLSILDSELSFDNQNESFSTATSLYIKSGVEATFGVSYGREIYQHKWGNLYSGIKVKYMTIDLSKQVLPIVQLANADLGDLIEDEYDQNQNRSSDFGLDVGFVWDAPRYRLGLTFEDLNSPEFEFGDVGVNCDAIPENTPSRSNCEAARFFSEVRGEIAQREIHTKDVKARLDGLITPGGGVYLSAAVDLAEYNDYIGAQHQWIHAGIDYQTDWPFLSSLRAGYHANLVGTEISSATLGFTLFDSVNLDFEYGLEDVVVDGSTAPRRFGFALSIEEQF
ncbi:conjugal transfer protein TraF [Alteromonas sp. ASW11-36]|uniref:Conjugal transfer protein TraF n=1 Tax=Alteromonas arenosi TaxID=3055817 RepID=A0ABT7SXP5_9ALTE|nr:conjugal transfer protein TraF [Alteromonas sp. ASW11-36]MDM7860312.1 conjugal transfer protein TraF [Alteromonas sp. ASW11-36]